MAPLPIEIIAANDAVARMLDRAIRLANDIQIEFVFLTCGENNMHDAVRFSPAKEVHTTQLFNELHNIRQRSRGFHPFIITFTDAYLRGNEFENLFASHDSGNGLSVVTFHEVRDIVGDTDDALTGYVLYYFGRFAMSFSSPSIKCHSDLRRCIYDKKIIKREIINSFRSGAICDDCRRAISQSGKGTIAQIDAVNAIIERASSLVHKTQVAQRPKIFIASSTISISYARALKTCLENDFDVKVWDEDQVFRLGRVTIEQLEEHIKHYDFGIFIMLPDDKITRGDKEHMVPRDNVVFEAGLFAGRLSRERTIIVTANDGEVLLPSDLAGLTTSRVKLGQQLPECMDEAARKIGSHIRYVFGESEMR